MPDLMAPDVSVVLPEGYRTAAMVSELWQRLTVMLKHEAVSFELIFVDDACPEGSRPDHCGGLFSRSTGDPAVA